MVCFENQILLPVQLTEEYMFRNNTPTAVSILIFFLLGVILPIPPVSATPQLTSGLSTITKKAQLPTVTVTPTTPIVEVGTPAFPKSNAVPAGKLSPSSGPWHTFVHITGERMGNAISVRTVWYPNDDDTQPALGSISTTLRSVNPKSGAEIEIPANAGGSKGGVVRIMLTVQGEKAPIFAGRFTVDNRAVKTLPARSILVSTLTLLGSGPTANVTVPDMTITGAGPTSKVAVNTMLLIGSGPTSSVTVQVMTLTGSGPTASVSVPIMSLNGSKQPRQIVVPP
jgi:hypothetical protein